MTIEQPKSWGCRDDLTRATGLTTIETPKWWRSVAI